MWLKKWRSRRNNSKRTGTWAPDHGWLMKFNSSLFKFVVYNAFHSLICDGIIPKITKKYKISLHVGPITPQKQLKSQLWMSQKPKRYIYFFIYAQFWRLLLFWRIYKQQSTWVHWLHNMCIDRDQKPGQKMKMIDKSRNWNVTTAAPAGKHEN